MEELQRKLDQRYENTSPRKVRFKLASSYSGRVLKHVYEDGQELDSPAEKYPHSFVHRKIPPSHLEMDQYCGFEDGTGGDHQGAYPPTGLIAHRINVYRGVGSYKAAAGQSGAEEGDAKNTVLDFGKIVIYTSNLRIIRAPKKPETERHQGAPAVEQDGHPKAKERSSRRRRAASTQPSEEREDRERKLTEGKDPDICQQCGGSGCAPCSLCHGSKLSMLANRFNESISDLRCQACYPHGLERCQSCSAK
ncbi:hypothetical protein WMY93_008638 [Mugilogobius chulae]|uniref:Glutaredoxin domain-containing cysteine-rich protein 2 n=1 Tax=Mugilogobius chulae TaxID=88201 RepID=A0AAW0PGU5_9GOBI